MILIMNNITLNPNLRESPFTLACFGLNLATPQSLQEDYII